MRIVMLGVDFTLHQPPELAEQLIALSERIRRATTAD